MKETEFLLERLSESLFLAMSRQMNPETLQGITRVPLTPQFMAESFGGSASRWGHILNGFCELKADEKFLLERTLYNKPDEKKLCLNWDRGKRLKSIYDQSGIKRRDGSVFFPGATYNELQSRIESAINGNAEFTGRQKLAINRALVKNGLKPKYKIKVTVKT